MLADRPLPRNKVRAYILHCGFKGVGVGSDWQAIGQVETRRTDPIVGHAVVHVEPIRCAKIVAAIDAGGKNDIGDGTVPFLRQLRP